MGFVKADAIVGNEVFAGWPRLLATGAAQPQEVDQTGRFAMMQAYVGDLLPALQAQVASNLGHPRVILVVM